LRPEFSIQHLLNEFEGSLCSSIDNVPKISEINVTNPKTNVVLVPKDFSNILKEFETKKVSVLNMKRYQMSKLKEQKLVWVDQVAKLLDFVIMFEKSKSKISQLEFEVTMLQETCKKGGGFMLYPQPMLHCPDYVLDVNDPKCLGKSIIIVNECHVCAQSFPCKNIIVVSCGHTYHVSCIAYVATTHQFCKVVDCGQAFHHNWLSTIEI